MEKSTSLRDTLFGDTPLSALANKSIAAEPWMSFAAAKASLDSGNRNFAIATLRRILAMPSLESRHYLQAWLFLRENGIAPSLDQAKVALGIVVELSSQGDLDLVAAYRDHHARYYNFTGAGIVWEHPENRFDHLIDSLLNEAATLVRSIGPWVGNRPPAPTVGYARINILTPSGLHFGQAPIDAWGKDARGGKLFHLSFQLMRDLIKLRKPAVKS
jgi:hypothetical protein